VEAKKLFAYAYGMAEIELGAGSEFVNVILERIEKVESFI
jgi:hypothetical protein